MIKLPSSCYCSELKVNPNGWPLIDIKSDAAKDAVTSMEKFITKTSS